MDRVTGPARMAPLTITAHLATGVAIDPRFGIALDGILAAAARAAAAPHQRPSTVDGGLNTDTPHLWPLPLARCGDGDDWHWAATSGWLAGPDGQPAPDTPDVHRLHQSLAGRRAALTVTRLPDTIPRTRRRFRDRLTYLPVYPCSSIVWHAIGNPEQVTGLLNEVWSVGARRGAGEGAVTRWDIIPSDVPDSSLFAHSHPDGSQGRPLPARCVQTHNFPFGTEGVAGVRPPTFHPANMRPVMFPAGR